MAAFYMETAYRPGVCLCCIYCHSPADLPFTACGASGGVYEFIKAHDASSCIYNFRHEHYTPIPHRHPPCFLTIPAHSFNLVKPSKLGRSRACYMPQQFLTGDSFPVAVKRGKRSAVYNLQTPRSLEEEGWLLL